jgi:uncharacterized protein YukE
MSVLSALLRFAEQVVQQVQQGFTQQMNIVSEQAYNPLQTLVQQTVKDSWRGVGADAFVEEVSSLHMPGVNSIMDQITAFQKNLANAGETMKRADQEAHQSVQALAETFEKIIQF